jgi:hypothetical protein
LAQVSNCSEIRGVGQLIRKEKKIFEINFFQFGHLLCQITPQYRTKNLNEFEILFLLGLDFQSPIWTLRLTSNFSRFSRASRVLLISINRPLNIEDKHTSFGNDQRLLQEGFSLVFLFFLVIFLWGWFSSKLCVANTLSRARFKP